MKDLTKPTSISKLPLALACVLALASAAVTSSHAEITYTKQQLTVNGNDSTSTNGIKINQMNGIYMLNKNPRKVKPFNPGALQESSIIGGDNPWDQSQYQECTLSIYLKDEYPALYGNDNRINFYNPGSKTYNKIYVSQVYNESDVRAKQDVSDLTGGLSALLKLRPVSYRWIAAPTSDEAGKDAASKYGSGDSELQYGFIAQEVEKVFPDMVATDTDGNKAINYISLIPVLVKSVQELQGQLATQSAVIDNLNSQLAVSRNAEVRQEYIVSCTPNPTQGELTVSYSLLPSTTDARILVTNLTGSAVASVECNVSDTSVSLRLDGVPSGLYLATLVCNGEVRDSKQIVVSR